jgi:hypothetical protein
MTCPGEILCEGGLTIPSHSWFPGNPSSDDDNVGSAECLGQTIISRQKARDSRFGVNVVEIGGNARCMDEIVEGDFRKEIALFAQSAFGARVNAQTAHSFAKETKRGPNLTSSTKKSNLCHGGWLLMNELVILNKYVIMQHMCMAPPNPGDNGMAL